MREYEQNLIMRAALVQIASMTDPDDIHEDDDGFSDWGCSAEDAISMAYENCITIAQLTLGKITDG